MAEDTVGNVLGERATFVYTGDGGQDFNILLDATVGAAIGNPRSTSALLPVLKASQSRPIQPRYYLVQATADSRIKKRIICCNPDSLNWKNNNATTFTINNATYTVTGRVGEKRSALKVDAPAPPA